MRLEELTNEQERLIPNLGDRVLISLVNGCSPKELKEFDKYRAISQEHYFQIQIPWMEMDRYFLGQNTHHNPTEVEFCDDYTKATHNAERFRAFYVLKYENLVERIK